MFCVKKTVIFLLSIIKWSKVIQYWIDLRSSLQPPSNSDSERSGIFRVKYLNDLIGLLCLSYSRWLREFKSINFGTWLFRKFS